MSGESAILISHLNDLTTMEGQRDWGTNGCKKLAQQAIDRIKELENQNKEISALTERCESLEKARKVTDESWRNLVKENAELRRHLDGFISELKEMVHVFRRDGDGRFLKTADAIEKYLSAYEQFRAKEGKE